jgi:hypothetical protein
LGLLLLLLLLVDDIQMQLLEFTCATLRASCALSAARPTVSGSRLQSGDKAWQQSSSKGQCNKARSPLQGRKCCAGDAQPR